MAYPYPVVSKPVCKARVVEWSPDLGYGWLLLDNKRLFLHRRNYSGGGRAPSIGEEVSFILGEDSQGRACALNAQPTVSKAFSSPRRSLSGSVMSLLVLGVLLVLPALAFQRLFGENRMKAAYYAITISVITFIAYARD